MGQGPRGWMVTPVHVLFLKFNNVIFTKNGNLYGGDESMENRKGDIRRASVQIVLENGKILEKTILAPKILFMWPSALIESTVRSA